nr:arginine deiminase [Lachnospiraceae bacterium]
MPVCVRSEIGPLKKVMLKRPGKELEHLVPETMGSLLFDDIPFLHRAQEEHDRFAALLRSQGVQVLYLDELTAETLKANPGLREQFIRDAVEQAGPTARGYREPVEEYLSSIEDDLELIRSVMAGVPRKDLFPGNTGHLADLIDDSMDFAIPPMPNLYFTRDPFAIIGEGVSLHRMHTEIRNREVLFGQYIFNYHPDYKGCVKQYYTRNDHFSLEGGDILNLSENVLAVGISERTQAEAVDRLARNIFRDEESRIDTVLAFYIPHTRAFMHLDTVFTQVDHDKFTVHPGILPSLRIFEITGRGELKPHFRELDESPQEALARYLHRDKVELIRCGGSDRIAADREQWNDGSNTLCIAPGKVLVYDRNYVTNRLLEDAGITVLSFNGSELSRGRGGPRCMSMPFEREDL